MTYTRKTFDCEACGKRTPNALAITISEDRYCSVCVDALRDDVMACEECDCLLHPEDVRTSGDKQLCRDCLENTFEHCQRCDMILDPDYMGRTEYMLDGTHFCRTCFEREFDSCTECSELIRDEDTRYTPNRDAVCRDCFEELCVECHDCGDDIWIDDSQTSNGDRYCYDCYDDHSDSCGRGWEPRRFDPDSNAYRRIGSRRQFGIELEYNSTSHAKRTVDALRHFGCKDEHCGVEFYSSILQGDRGLSTVEDLANFATDNNWRINRSCGYHLHLDMRNEATERLHVLAYAYLKTYHIWRRFVDDWRRNACSFCHSTEETAGEIRAMSEGEFRHWMYCSERYNFVNWNAHNDHGSVEIRLHYATSDAAEIVNWVKVHARFVDWALEQDMQTVSNTFDGTLTHDFDALCEIWGSPGLRTYYRARASEHDNAIPARQRVTA